MTGLSLFLALATLSPVGENLSQRPNASADFDGRTFIKLTDKIATVWNARSGAVVFRVTSHKETVLSVQIGPSGGLALTSSHLPPNELSLRTRDDSIRLWDLATGKQRLYIPDATFGQFSRDGKRILGFAKRVSGEQIFDIAAWDVKTGKQLFTASTPGNDGVYPGSHYTLQESADGSRILFCQYARAGVYDGRTGKPIGEPWRLAQGGPSGFFAPSGDEAQFAEIRFVSYFSLAERKEIKRVPYAFEHAWTVGWRADGKGFAAVSASGSVMSYDRDTDKTVSAPGGVEVPQSVVVSPDSNLFIVNWGGANAIPPQARAFSAKSCARIWEGKGHVLGFTGRHEAVLLDGPDLSLIKTSTGRVVRKFKVNGAER